MGIFLLKNVDWNAALATLDKNADGNNPRFSRHSAQLLSLSALYISDFKTACRQLKQASRQEPLNPLHEFRKILLLAKFGEINQSALMLDQLKQLIPESPLVDYMRGLIALRSGRPEQARSIAKTLETTYPKFAYGKFLKAQAQIVLSNKQGAIERILMNLPFGAEYDSLWADILTKLTLLHPKDGPKQVQKYLPKKITPDSAAYEVVQRALAWANASSEELESYFERESPGSRAEDIILSCLVERLKQKGDNLEAVKMIAALRQRHPERIGLKRIQNVFIARLAMEKSSTGENEEALRLIEHCLREHPYDSVYHQNLAALFTLLRERDSYHEAWASLNRHQYRLIFLGMLNTEAVAQAAKSHRLFAQQARGYGEKSTASRSIFRKTISDELDKSERISVNRDEIAADPDLLRQWIYHSSAEIVFRHCLLSDNPNKFFLYPADRDEAAARCEGLTALAESLSTLVSEEGALLAERLIAHWQQLTDKVCTNYSVKQEDADDEVWKLQLQHLALLGDLSLFCLTWQPDASQLPLAEELLSLIHSEKAFFDEKIIYRLEQQNDIETPYPVGILATHLRETLGLERDIELTAEQRSIVIDSLIAELLLHMSNSAYNKEGSHKERVDRALSYLDRARACNPASARIEYESAQVLILGEFYDEAQTSLQRFYRLVSLDEHELLSDAEKYEQILKEKRKENSSKKRDKSELDDLVIEKSETRLTEIEKELDRAPASWRLYEEMVQELVKAGQFDEAVIWADRAVAHCLSKELQMNARALAIEARGLKTLSEEYSKPARLYASGVHEPARKVIQSFNEEQLDYKLLFLLGRCQLANETPDKAQVTFKKAMSLCESQLHRTVLRYLTDNIDNAYLAVARNSVNTALQEGAVEEAAAKSAALFAQLQEPAAWLIDFARVFYSAALTQLGTARPSLTVPPININADWKERLNKALLHQNDIERALAITELAEDVCPQSKQQTQSLKRRIQTLKHQIFMSESLNHAGRLLTAKKFEEVSAYLEQLEQSLADEPRFVRIHVLALLGLNRFDDADMLVQKSREGATSELRSFIEEYPKLVFRQRLAIAHRHLREAKINDAVEVLKNAAATDDKQEADLAYCRAFALVMYGYQLRRQNRNGETRDQFSQAINLLEAHLNAATTNGQSHIIELYDKLEKELETYDRV